MCWFVQNNRRLQGPSVSRFCDNGNDNRIEPTGGLELCSQTETRLTKRRWFDSKRGNKAKPLTRAGALTPGGVRRYVIPAEGPKTLRSHRYSQRWRVSGERETDRVHPDARRERGNKASVDGGAVLRRCAEAGSTRGWIYPELDQPGASRRFSPKSKRGCGHKINPNGKKDPCRNAVCALSAPPLVSMCPSVILPSTGRAPHTHARTHAHAHAHHRDYTGTRSVSSTEERNTRFNAKRRRSFLTSWKCCGGRERQRERERERERERGK